MHILNGFHNLSACCKIGRKSELTFIGTKSPGLQPKRINELNDNLEKVNSVYNIKRTVRWL